MWLRWFENEALFPDAEFTGRSAFKSHRNFLPGTTFILNVVHGSKWTVPDQNIYRMEIHETFTQWAIEKGVQINGIRPHRFEGRGTRDHC